MKRTPRNFDGISPTGKNISDLLPSVLKDIREKNGQQSEEVFHYWLELIGEKMASLTEPISFEEGVLTVKVKSSTLYSLLCYHERPRLMKRLQEKFSIRNLLFRIG
jgi:hypothetical protein